MNPADYLAAFADPDPRFTPVPAWWWSGEPLRWPKMKWQMERMRAMGLRNFVVIGLAPSGAMFGSDADDPPFMSEAWWDLFGKVCDHAKSLGMFVWFYDQIGFSGAEFPDRPRGRPSELVGPAAQERDRRRPGELTVRCPDVGTPVAAYFTSGDRVEYVPLNDRTATFHAQSAGTLRLVYSIRQAYDYFNPEACQALLDTVHREYARRLGEHVGTTLVGSFQDELPELPTWGATFAETFAEAFGYRLENVMHRLFESGDADARRTRVHFHQHRANLAEAAFFKPFFDWHESHGLQCGYDQQSPAREARLLGCVEKYADYLQTQKWYALPGSDLHGNGKLHSSIAFLNHRPRVWLEGFHSTGWGGTIADTFDWLLPYLQSGVTLYNPHAIYYSTGKGWWEWAPPSTCWRQPYAMHYSGFADTIARLTKLLSQGTHQATVGVLFPTATAQSAIGAEQHFDTAKLADETLHDVLGSMRWHQVRTGTLDAKSIAHHVLDEPAIQAGGGTRGPIVFERRRPTCRRAAGRHSVAGRDVGRTPNLHGVGRPGDRRPRGRSRNGGRPSVPLAGRARRRNRRNRRRSRLEAGRRPRRRAVGIADPPPPTGRIGYRLRSRGRRHGDGREVGQLVRADGAHDDRARTLPRIDHPSPVRPRSAGVAVRSDRWLVPTDPHERWRIRHAHRHRLRRRAVCGHRLVGIRSVRGIGAAATSVAADSAAGRMGL